MSLPLAGDGMGGSLRSLPPKPFWDSLNLKEAHLDQDQPLEGRINPIYKPKMGQRSHCQLLSVGFKGA